MCAIFVVLSRALGAQLNMLALSAVVATVAAAIGAWTASGHSEEDGLTSEFLAAARLGRLSVLTEIIEAAAVHVDACGEDGETALHAAAAAGHAKAVALLLSLGADARAVTTSGGRLPAHVAAERGQVAALLELLGRDVMSAVSTDYSGRQPIHCACENAQLAVVEVLLARGVAVDVPCSTTGATPLALTCHCDAIRFEAAALCVRVLLDHRADVAAADVHGDLPLHHACRVAAAVASTSSGGIGDGGSSGDGGGDGDTGGDGGDGRTDVTEVVTVLCDHGAPLFVANRRHETPLDLAADHPGVRGVLDDVLAARLRAGHREANAATAVRGRLVHQLRVMAASHPLELRAICEHDEMVKSTLRRFALDPAAIAPPPLHSAPPGANSRGAGQPVIVLDGRIDASRGVRCGFSSTGTPDGGRGADADNKLSSTARVSRELKGMLTALSSEEVL